MARKTIKGLEAELQEQKQQKYKACNEIAQLLLKLDSAMLGETSYVNRIEILKREVQSLKDKLTGSDMVSRDRAAIIQGLEQDKERIRSEFIRQRNDLEGKNSATYQQLRKEIDAREVLEKEKQYLADALAEARERERVLKEKLEDAEDRAEHHQTQLDLVRQEAHHSNKAHERAMYALGAGLGGRCL